MALEWVDEIERRAYRLTAELVEWVEPVKPREVILLCRAVRELAGALDRVLASQWFDLPDALRDEANAILERWRRGDE